ncbi:MAG: hypothetical protein EAY75_15990 [Bacteroidetes bacterium]|nr:MAG: hypothetical protein EAY75_15990 [Bacteroidota bacterium]
MKKTIRLLFASLAAPAQKPEGQLKGLTKPTQKSPLANTILLRNIAGVAGSPALFMVGFDSEKLTQSKGWDGSVKGSKFNFVVDQSGTILTELSPDELSPGNPAFLPGTPIGGIVVKGGRNPGGQMRELKTDENGKIVLPDDWLNGEYSIQIKSKTQNTAFVLTIGSEKIEKADALNMLVDINGAILNFYYEEDFQLNGEIAKYLGVEKIVIAKGYYRVGQNNWGNVTLKVKNGGQVNGTIVVSSGNIKFFEGTDPKGLDCKSFGVACFYDGERGIDKKDVRHYVVKPIIERGVLISVEISERKKGLNAVNLKKGINQSGIK